MISLRICTRGESLEIQNWNEKKEITFDELVKAVRVTSEASQASTLKAINRMLTMRNWLIGYYIVEFEQKGKERAQYGDKLLKQLEVKVDIPGMTVTTFKLSRSFYRLYPQMSDLFVNPSYIPERIGATASHQLQAIENQAIQKGATVSHQFISSPEALISRLSFSHIRELLTIDDPLVRYFYESEWTTNSSSQPTSSSCRTKAHWKNSCCDNSKKINSSYQRERRELAHYAEPQGRKDR